jgi:proteasome accessory factor A
MAIPKVCGIETEYGIQVVGGDPNPIAASSLLINAYAHDVARQQTEWDFEDEAPGNDARGFAREGSMPPQVETHLVNTVLTNGSPRPSAAMPSNASGTTVPARWS